LKTSCSSSNMLSVHVQVEVKEDCVDGFIAASLANATNSVQEAGVSRFDFVQETEAPTKFQLVEIYSAADAPAKHKETAHYNAWRETVADMMQVPRTNVKYNTVFPTEKKAWDVPSDLASGQASADAHGVTDLLAVHVFVNVKPDCVAAFRDASIANASKSIDEPGVSRFDLLQQADDETKFALVEVYNSPDAPAKHKETAHYNTWRETVADMMAEPRTNIKFRNLFPKSEHGWVEEK